MDPIQMGQNPKNPQKRGKKTSSFSNLNGFWAVLSILGHFQKKQAYIHKIKNEKNGKKRFKKNDFLRLKYFRFFSVFFEKTRFWHVF